MHDQKTGYLHSSPEYAMKRLISNGLTDIYQLTHVFRFGEEGSYHSPEFMMAEWYKKGISFDEIISDTLNFIRLFVSDLPARHICYRRLFLEHTGIDYVVSKESDLSSFIEKHMQGYPKDVSSWDKDTLLQYILSFFIEPLLGESELVVIKHFPSSQAALAQLQTIDDEIVGERFEVYYKGIELANGYHELTDAVEQRKRLIASNKARQSLGKMPLPLDELFLSALEKGLPDCCGVAVGFDRLMMLRHHKTNIADVMPMTWSD
jgi:lysyl-tRNA synthetase class 2